ncbi:GNAT family N-acetyltransferase [Streptomyces sasae]|uniref:GNAT family N-acetyltransferase n=1 Tax=Streptomyces sasae TaxID=1266772 RepID=UPI0029311CD4|nr:GNAT family N-acetyltransferase [Streptomyces sasae]
MEIQVREVLGSSPEDDPVWTLIDELGQSDWVRFTAGFHLSSHLLAAYSPSTLPMGFCRYVVQPVGPDTGCPPVTVQGQAVREAKILAFGVHERWRRRGVGTALQRAVIAAAGAKGCHQVRSHSSGENAENHQLKLRLGFAVHPIVRDDDDRGCYFVLPLLTRRPAPTRTAPPPTPTGRQTDRPAAGDFGDG